MKRHYVIASFVARWVSGEGEPSEELGRVIWADEKRLAPCPSPKASPNF